MKKLLLTLLLAFTCMGVFSQEINTLAFSMNASANPHGWPSANVGATVTTKTSKSDPKLSATFYNAWWQKSKENSTLVFYKSSSTIKGYIEFKYDDPTKIITGITISTFSGTYSKFDLLLNGSENLGQFFYVSATNKNDYIEIPPAQQAVGGANTFRIQTANTGNQCGFQKITFHYIDASQASSVVAPSIEQDKNTITLTNNNETGSVYYSINNETCDATSTPYTAPFTVKRHDVVRAVAIVDGEASAVSILKDINWNSYESLAVFNAEKPATVSTLDFPLTVIAQSDYQGNMWVKDHEGTYTQITGYIATKYKQGDIIPAGTKGTYNSISDLYPAIKNPENFLAATENTPLTPELVNIADLGKYVYHYVKVKNVNLTASELSDGTTKYPVSDDFNTNCLGDGLIAFGLVDYYSSKVYFYPISVIGTPQKVIATPTPLNEDITIARGEKVTFFSRNATKLKVDINDEITIVEGDTYEYTVTGNAEVLITVTPIDNENNPVEEAAIMVTVTPKAALPCGSVTLNNYGGNVYAGTEITINCLNAVKICYTLNGGAVQEATTFPVSLTINTNTVLEAWGVNVDGVEGQHTPAEYNVIARTLEVTFDFKNNTYGLDRVSGTVADADHKNTELRIDETTPISVVLNGNIKLYTGGLRFYGDPTISIKSTQDYSIEKIVFSKNVFKTGTSTGGTDTWTNNSVGSVNSVEFKTTATGKDSELETLTVYYHPATTEPVLDLASGATDGAINVTVSEGQHIWWRTVTEYWDDQPASAKRRISSTTSDWTKISSNTATINFPTVEDRTTVRLEVAAFEPTTGKLSTPASYTIGKDNKGNWTVTGIENVENATAPAVYYNLQGLRVENPANGTFIRIQGGKAIKVAM